MALRIKEILKEKSITQIELATVLGISKIGVNKLINGNPTVETLQKIADALDIDIRDLFTSTKDDNQTLYILENEEYKPIGSIKKL